MWLKSCIGMQTNNNDDDDDKCYHHNKTKMLKVISNKIW